MSREKLIEMALNNKKHSDAGTMEYVDSILEIPAANYYDPDIWQKEVDLIFKRTPLVLGVSKEIPNQDNQKMSSLIHYQTKLSIRKSKKQPNLPTSA